MGDCAETLISAASPHLTVLSAWRGPVSAGTRLRSNMYEKLETDATQALLFKGFTRRKTD